MNVTDTHVHAYMRTVGGSGKQPAVMRGNGPPRTATQGGSCTPAAGTAKLINEVGTGGMERRNGEEVY